MVPHEKLDQIWQSYELFENAFGQKHFCTRFISEYTGKQARAKTAFKELKRLYGNMDTKVDPSRTPRDLHIEQWRKIVTYEEENPVGLELESYEMRMNLLFQQILLPMHYCTEFWYSFFSFLNQKKKFQMALRVLENAVERLPLDLFLRLMYCQYLETEAVKDIDLAEKSYIKLLDDFHNTNPPKNCPLGLIHYLNFIRRHKPAHEWRMFFMEQTHVSPHVSWEVFASHALSEYHVNDKVDAATKTFRLGIERFPQEALLINSFVNFLISVNDVRGARAQLSLTVRGFLQSYQQEKLVGSVTEVKRIQESLNILFEKWQRLETLYGSDSATTVQKLLDTKQQLFDEVAEDTDAAVDQQPLEIQPLGTSMREAMERFRFQHLLPEVAAGMDLLDMDGGLKEPGIEADIDLRALLRDHERLNQLDGLSSHVIARPDVTKMLAFRPVHDLITNEKEKHHSVPKCLQDLLALLPTKPLKGSAPDTDYLLTVLQTVDFPNIPLSSFNVNNDSSGLPQDAVPDQGNKEAFFSSRATVYRQRLLNKRQKIEEAKQ